MVIKFNLKKLIISLLIPLAVGGLSTLITGGDMKIYGEINQPPFSPPFIVFPIVWVVLYILMGVSFYLVWNSKAAYEEKKSAFIFYFVSLLLNFIWSPVFFSLKQFLLAFVILVALFITVIITAVKYNKIDKNAALLQIPYLVWLAVAGYLNIGIYLLN